MAPNAEELLIAVILANRRDQHPSGRQPLDKGRRNLCRCSSDYHAIVGRQFRPTLRPVTESADNVVQPQFAEAALGIAQQPAMPLDREHPAAQACEDRSLIPRTGTDLERIVPLAKIEILGHQRDHVRLADRLTLADRQGRVLVGLIFKGGRHDPLEKQASY